jgi:large subunit ribosomal protein L13
MERETIIIDAQGKALGRLASQIAIFLQGKHKPNFLPYKDMGDFVIVKNVEKIKLTGKKMKQKKYYRHSGYLGGLKEIPLEEIFRKRPASILKMAVQGMLPKNKLRAQMLKRLKIE